EGRHPAASRHSCRSPAAYHEAGIRIPARPCQTGAAPGRASRGKRGGGRMQTQDGGETAACRVLLVEDDEPLRQRFAGILQAWAGGVLVAACASLAEALPHLRAAGVDLLITDLRLPDGHGTQAIRTLRASN